MDMVERSIFLAALDIDDPVERSVYLEEPVPAIWLCGRGSSSS
jgi:hypothetical protein